MTEINIIENADGELRVSSLIIAARTERDHAAILRTIRDNLADFEQLGRVSFENRPFDTNGGTQLKAYALLNEPQSTLLITFMRNNPIVIAFKLELVKQFYAMRQALTQPQYELPQTHAEALRALAASVEVNDALLAKIAEDAPAVGYVETFVTGNDLMLLRDVAKNLGITETMLRADLLERGWLYKQTSSRWSEKAQKKLPQSRYSSYAHKARYFRHVPNHEAPRFRDETMHTLKVTPRGAAAIARLYAGSDDFLDGIETSSDSVTA